MSYIEKSLAGDEKVVKLFHLNKYTLITPWLIMIFSLGLLMYGISIENDFIPWYVFSITSISFLLLGFYNLLYLKSIEYGLTTHRVVTKRGLIAIDTQEILLEAIETIEIKQTILGRIFGFGDVFITGRGSSSLNIAGVDNPIVIKREIEKYLYSKE